MQYIGKKYLSTLGPLDLLRDKYLIDKENIIEYKSFSEEDDFRMSDGEGDGFFLLRILETNFYLIGDDADRAAAFLSSFRDVEKKILELYRRIEAIPK